MLVYSAVYYAAIRHPRQFDWSHRRQLNSNLTLIFFMRTSVHLFSSNFDWVCFCNPV